MQGQILQVPFFIAFLKVMGFLIGLMVGLNGCSGGVWNNPYPVQDNDKNILYATFESRPKHLYPVRSYSSNEYAIIANIYEPPLQYHYLKRPYTLVPLAATEVPKPVFLDTAGNRLPDDAPVEAIAHSMYEIRI